MTGLSTLFVVALLCTGQADVQTQAPGKLVLDLWEAAYIQGGKAGYVHTTVYEVQGKEPRVLRCTKELRLAIKRFNDTIPLRMDIGTDETTDGKVVATFSRQFLGRDKQLTVTGTVVGKQLRLVQDGTTPIKPADWNEEAIGQYRQLRFFHEKRSKPGDEVSFLSFDPSISRVVRTDVRVKDYELVEPFQGKAKKRLLRVEIRPEKIENVQLPTLVAWLDDELLPVRSQTDLPGLGQLILYRTSKAVATSPGPIATLADVGIGNYIRLKRRIPQALDTRQMVYRVTVKDDEEPTTIFSRDDRQAVKNVQGNSYELHVRASTAPKGGSDDKSPGDEFLQSSYFITSADAKVREHARAAVGTETDPWRKVLRIEKWVHDNMKGTNEEALATADHVARTLEGDCTEYAMLAAAMCRAEGVPSRTAVGLIYAEPANGPVFAFHMWTEVWLKGRWVPVDATLGRAYVGATHLKITDASWQDTRALTPLLPVLRALGKVSIEVVDGPP